MATLRLLTVAALAVASVRGTSAQSTRPTAVQITAMIVERTGIALPSPTVDTFKAGDPNTPVRGIAVTMMATLDVLKRAAAGGNNLIITHEPTFYGHRDDTDAMQEENDPVLAAKRKFIADNRLVVWRFHDLPHSMRPDMIRKGVVRAIGWEGRQSDTTGQVFKIAPTTLDALASSISKRLNSNGTRIVGDPTARVSSVAITQGFPGFATNRHALQLHEVNVLVIGEDHEWETIEYATDAISAGQLKGLIVLGHVPSEQAGMEEVARWLRTFITAVPVTLVPTRDPFRPLR